MVWKVAIADPATVNFLMANCTAEQNALDACNKLVKDLDTENFVLRQEIGVIVKERDSATASLEKATEPRLLPNWAWFLIGAGLGAGIYAAVRH
jgi:hypothetical protein